MPKIDKIQQIVLHVFPWEIDEFERLADLFKRNSKYLAENDIINMDVSMNISPDIIDWDKSKIPSDFYLDKFHSILNKFDWTNSNIVEIVEDASCLGCVDKRRNSLRQIDDGVDIVTWIDTDIVFSDYHLSLMRRTFDEIDGDYYIVTGQLPKMWDKFWDGLVNKHYKDYPYLNADGTKPYHKYDTFDINPLVSNSLNDITVEKIWPFHFGGGFMTSFSSKLLKLTDIPDSFGSYGLEDTYVQQCSLDMKHTGYDINQYSIVNSLISEDNLYKKYIHKDYLKLQDSWMNHNRKKSEDNFQKEIMEFRNNKLGVR